MTYISCLLYICWCFTKCTCKKYFLLYIFTKKYFLKHPIIFTVNLMCLLFHNYGSSKCQIFSPQYIGTAKQQVTFTAGVREMLRVAAQDIVDHQPAAQQS